MPKHKTNLKFNPNNATQLHAVKTSDLILLLLKPDDLKDFVLDDEVVDRTLSPMDQVEARATHKSRQRIGYAAIAAEIDRRLPVV